MALNLQLLHLISRLLWVQGLLQLAFLWAMTLKSSQPQALSLLTSDWKTSRVNSLRIVRHESLLTSRTSVNCAKNSMPNVHRMLKEIKKASLTKELKQGHITRQLIPHSWQEQDILKWLHTWATIISHSTEHQALGSDWFLQTPSLTSLPGSCFVTRLLISSRETRITLGFITCNSHAPHIGMHTQSVHEYGRDWPYCLFLTLDNWHMFRLSHRLSLKHLASCLPPQLWRSLQFSVLNSLQPPTERSPCSHLAFLPYAVWKSIENRLALTALICSLSAAHQVCFGSTPPHPPLLCSHIRFCP